VGIPQAELATAWVVAKETVTATEVELAEQVFLHNLVCPQPDRNAKRGRSSTCKRSFLGNRSHHSNLDLHIDTTTARTVQR